MEDLMAQGNAFRRIRIVQFNTFFLELITDFSYIFFSGLKVLEAHGLNSHTNNDLVHHLDLTLVSDLTDLPEVILLTLGLQQDLSTPLGIMHLHDLKDPLYLLNNQGMEHNPVMSLAFK